MKMPCFQRDLLRILPCFVLLLGKISALSANSESQETRLETDHALSEVSSSSNENTPNIVEDASPTPFSVSSKLSLIQPSDYTSTTPSQLTEISRAFLTIDSLIPQSQRQTWGSHPIGSKESFQITGNNPDLKWIAYFYDQAVVAVLLSRNGTIQKCKVQENIEKWEQEKALEFLSDIMPLQPIAFDSMVHLITLCGTLNIPPPSQPNPNHAGLNAFWWLDFSPIQGILPGTLWCGVRDRATYYHELGRKQKVDNCCRAHDHCPIKIRGLTQRYGAVNLGVNTLVHCTCDLEFYRCLKEANTDTANLVGQVFFNYLDIKCLDAPPDKKNFRGGYDRSPRGSYQSSKPPGEHGTLICVRYDNEGGCRKWELKPEDFSVELVISRLGLKF